MAGSVQRTDRPLSPRAADSARPAGPPPMTATSTGRSKEMRVSCRMHAKWSRSDDSDLWGGACHCIVDRESPPTRWLSPMKAGESAGSRATSECDARGCVNPHRDPSCCRPFVPLRMTLPPPFWSRARRVARSSWPCVRQPGQHWLTCCRSQSGMCVRWRPARGRERAGLLVARKGGPGFSACGQGGAIPCLARPGEGPDGSSGNHKSIQGRYARREHSNPPQNRAHSHV